MRGTHTHYHGDGTRTVGCTCQEPDAEVEARRRLIAAAPLLLAACQKAQAEFRDQKKWRPNDHGGFCGCGVCNTLDYLGEAIAAALPPEQEAT